MSIKSLLFAVLFSVTSLHAAGIYPLTNQSLTINKCNIEVTDNMLDLALANDGYFVVSQGKKSSELLFTRYGRLMLNPDGYIVNQNGSFLLGINSKSDPSKLTKFKVSSKPLPPKATAKVRMVLNLNYNNQDNSSFKASTSIYDTAGDTHILTIEYKKISINSWSAQAFVDDIKLDKGTLTFKDTGKLSKQEGLSYIQWPGKYGLNELKVDHTGTTSYARPSSLESIRGDGYAAGYIVGMTIDMHGGISLLYTNGQFKKLKNNIAVAKFTNPTFLEPVIDHLYRQTEKSGPRRLHRANSEYAIISGALEQEPCFVG